MSPARAGTRTTRSGVERPNLNTCEFNSQIPRTVSHDLVYDLIQFWLASDWWQTHIMLTDLQQLSRVISFICCIIPELCCFLVRQKAMSTAINTTNKTNPPMAPYAQTGNFSSSIIQKNIHFRSYSNYVFAESIKSIQQTLGWTK